MYDMLIVGAGPAGISAALTAQHRGRSVLVTGSDYRESPLAKAHVIRNYPGVTGTGLELLEAMHRQLRELEIPVVTRRVLQAMPVGGHFACSAGSDVYEAKSLLLCTGLPGGRELEGEREYLGKGVSRCATCDGMLYRAARRRSRARGARPWRTRISCTASAARSGFLPAGTVPKD